MGDAPQGWIKWVVGSIVITVISGLLLAWLRPGGDGGPRADANPTDPPAPAPAPRPAPRTPEPTPPAVTPSPVPKAPPVVAAAPAVEKVITVGQSAPLVRDVTFAVEKIDALPGGKTRWHVSYFNKRPADWYGAVFYVADTYLTDAAGKRYPMTANSVTTARPNDLWAATVHAGTKSEFWFEFAAPAETGTTYTLRTRSDGDGTARVTVAVP